MKFPPVEKRVVSRTAKMPTGRDCIFFSFRERNAERRKRRENARTSSYRGDILIILHSKVAANVRRIH